MAAEHLTSVVLESEEDKRCEDDGDDSEAVNPPTLHKEKSAEPCVRRRLSYPPHNSSSLPLPLRRHLLHSDKDAAMRLMEEVAGLTDHHRVDTIKNVQLAALSKMRGAVQTLTTFNDFSRAQLHLVLPDFQRRTRMLKEMRSDLDSIFRRLRVMRERLEGVHTTLLQRRR